MVKAELVVSILPGPRLEVNASPLERDLFTLPCGSSKCARITNLFFLFWLVSEKADADNT